MTVFLVAKAKLVAKLVDTKVLPDDTMNEVNIMTCPPSFRSFMYSRLDRIRRKDSESESRPFSFTETTCPFTSPSNGTSPKKGTLELFCTSTLSWMVVSIILRSSMMAIGMAKPINIPIKVARFSSGATGL